VYTVDIAYDNTGNNYVSGYRTFQRVFPHFLSPLHNGPII